MDIALDDEIAKKIVDNMPFFRHVHPNVISTVSIVFNIIILSILINNNLNPLYLIGSFAVRWLTDLLDGAVARKYKKASKLGGLLDTVGNVTIILIFMWYVLKATGVHMMVFYIFLIVVLLYVVHAETYHNHAALKHYKGNHVQKIIAFFVNNSYLIYIAMYFFIHSYSI
jgi:phosphatidylglycerophosphate synthase